MKITLYTADANCNELIIVKCSHISMFDVQYQIKIKFIYKEEQMKLITCLIQNYVLFQCQGDDIIIIPENNQKQRVRYRFDS
jgi:hypothetical protein